jgi:hypothetical protein
VLRELTGLVDEVDAGDLADLAIGSSISPPAGSSR